MAYMKKYSWVILAFVIVAVIIFTLVAIYEPPPHEFSGLFI